MPVFITAYFSLLEKIFSVECLFSIDITDIKCYTFSMVIKIHKSDIAWFVQNKGIAYTYERTLAGLCRLLDLNSNSIQYYKKHGMPISKILGSMVLIDMFEVMKWFHTGKVKIKIGIDELHEIIRHDIIKLYHSGEDAVIQKQLIEKFNEIVKDYEKSREKTNN